jgi:hypothetical protein
MINVYTISDSALFAQVLQSNVYLLTQYQITYKSSYIQLSPFSIVVNGTMYQFPNSTVIPLTTANLQNPSVPTIPDGVYILELLIINTATNYQPSLVGAQLNWPQGIYLIYAPIATQDQGAVALAQVTVQNSVIQNVSSLFIPLFDNLVAQGSNTTTLLNNLIEAVGTDSQGKYIPPPNAGNLSKASNLTMADLILYQYIQNNSATLQNIIQASGLLSDGKFSPNTSDHYISNALSLANATDLLDQAIYTLANNLNVSITQIQNQLNTLNADFNANYIINMIGQVTPIIYANRFIYKATNQTNVTINHNLQSKNIIYNCYDTNNNNVIPQSFNIVDANNVNLVFNPAFNGSIILLTLPN